LEFAVCGSIPYNRENQRTINLKPQTGKPGPLAWNLFAIQAQNLSFAAEINDEKNRMNSKKNKDAIS